MTALATTRLSADEIADLNTLADRAPAYTATGTAATAALMGR